MIADTVASVRTVGSDLRSCSMKSVAVIYDDAGDTLDAPELALDGVGKVPCIRNAHHVRHVMTSVAAELIAPKEVDRFNTVDRIVGRFQGAWRDTKTPGSRCRYQR